MAIIPNNGVNNVIEVIKEQASELRNAFQISYDIDDLLIGLLEENKGQNYISNI